MTVYIEYVLIDNFLIDYILLKATFALTKTNSSRGRLFFAAFLGSLFALFYPLIEGVGFIAVLYKIVTGLLLIAIGAKSFSLRAYYINALIFFLFTFLVGGVIIGIFNIFNVKIEGEILIALIFIPVYFIIRIMSAIIKYFYRKKSVFSFVFNVEIKNGKTLIKVNGFVDSGNTVYDGEKPVIFCSKTLAKKLVGGNPISTKIKKLKVKTINGESQKTAFIIDEIKIYILDEPNIFKKVTVCVVDERAFDGYELLLHPKMTEVCYENKDNGKVKEVS